MTSPFNLYFAPFLAASKTPRGDQLNLYPRGTVCATEGEGSPPQKEVKECIVWFLAFRDEMREIAEMWSMPGSRPSSLRRRVEEESAESCKARISGEM